MTFVRIWRTRLDLERLDEYERFIEQRSLQMFEAQPGFTGVLYSRNRDEIAVISFWSDQAAVDALDTSTSYQDAVRAIDEAGYLIGSSRVEAFEVHAGTIETRGALTGRRAPDS